MSLVKSWDKTDEIKVKDINRLKIGQKWVHELLAYVGGKNKQEKHINM